MVGWPVLAYRTAAKGPYALLQRVAADANNLTVTVLNNTGIPRVSVKREAKELQGLITSNGPLT